MNRLTAAETATLADRIHSRAWGWKHAFEAWYLVYGEGPDYVIEADGTRTLVRDPVRFIKTNLDNLPVFGLQDIVQPDGTLQLDTAGQHRYRPLGELGDGFTAHERIQA